MFVGKYEVRLDTKHRVIVPQKMRESRSGDGSVFSEFYLTLGAEGCIFVYTAQGWERLMEEIGATKSLADGPLRTLQRLVAANAVACNCDAQGRIVLPPELRNHAGLKSDVLWVGAVNRAEIWDPKCWSEYQQRSVPQLSETLDIAAQAGFALPGRSARAESGTEQP